MDFNVKRKARHILRGRTAGFALLLILAAVLLSPAPARASVLCEDAKPATDDMTKLSTDSKKLIGSFMREIANYIDYDLTDTATAEILDRLDQYNVNLYPPLEVWWDDGKNDPTTSTLPALKAMAKEIHLARIDQTRQIGSLMDASSQNERAQSKHQQNVEAHGLYTPAESTCQVDSTGPGMNKSYYFSRALARAIAMEDTKRRENYLQSPKEIADNSGLFIRSAEAAATPAPVGGPAEIGKLWTEWCTLFYDPSVGDQGCDPTKPGTFPGMNTDLPGMLWGDKQTMTQDQLKQVVPAALRTLIDPFAPVPVQPGALAGSPGLIEMEARKTKNGRYNTIYNVLGQLLAERGGGASGVDANAINTVTGLQPDQGSDNASYADLRNALTKSRYLNPAYIVRLVSDPGAVVREQGSVNAIQAQLMNDLYKRTEEMVFMEAASYGDDLDRSHARPPVANTPVGQ